MTATARSRAFLVLSSLSAIALAAHETAPTTPSQDEQRCAALAGSNLQAPPGGPSSLSGSERRKSAPEAEETTVRFREATLKFRCAPVAMNAVHLRRFSLTSEVMEPVHCGTVNSRPFTTGTWAHSNFLSEGCFDVGVSSAA